MPDLMLPNAHLEEQPWWEAVRLAEEPSHVERVEHPSGL